MTISDLLPSCLNTLKPRKKDLQCCNLYVTRVNYFPLTHSGIRGKSLVINLVSTLVMTHCAGSRAQLGSLHGSSFRFLPAEQKKRARSRSEADFATLWTQGIRRKYKEGTRIPPQKLKTNWNERKESSDWNQNLLQEGDYLKKRWNPEIRGEENLKIERKLALENQKIVKFSILFTVTLWVICLSF